MNNARLYQFYNYDVDRCGEPFALCDECLPLQPVPPNCQLRKIADNAVRECDHSLRKEPKR